MNIHLPQSLQTRNELVQLAAVPYQVLTPKDSKPIICIVQDVALGVYRLTKSIVHVSEKQFFNLMATNTRFLGSIPPPDRVDGDAKEWSGRQVLSTIMPPNLNYRGANKSFDEQKKDDSENFVIIENGDIKQGRIDTKVYQDRTKGLIHSIYNEYGPEETRLFFDNTQQLICNWLVLSGFSVGISDLVIEETTQTALKEVIHNMKVKVYDVIRNIHVNNFQNDTRKSNNDKFEEEVNKLLNDTNKEAGTLGVSKIDDINNRMLNMIKSGAKGNILNIAQMIGCLGQQNIDGKRIPYGYDSRTLPHYTKYDDGPESRGFVENSFIKGLTPQEFFFHSMGGREGLIDTAVKSVTGETPLIILEDGVCKYVRIGDWIDTELAKSKEEVVHYTERQMELLNLKNKVFIPTGDEDGNITWGEVTAMTRHDPGTELYKVKTQGGKSVIVTESKSLLIWKEDIGKFKEVPTPEIKVGDFLPVTAKLMEPPVVVSSVDMCEYFPKTEYVHGTDFHMAIGCMQEAMKYRKHIVPNWWEKNNGTNFTLPYPSKARLQRTLVRSNTEAIKQGCIYPYHASREYCDIPEKFTLNKENGMFIGLFLAEGNTNASSVGITNNNVEVKTFVKQWFDKFSIPHTEVANENNVGASTTVRGSSIILARFLNEFVGQKSYFKHVPDVAFVAHEEFVVGILNGYFSGDGCIGKTSVESSSASARLTDGISMLCTRLGIFGKVFTTQLKSNNLGTKNIAPSHRLAIRGQWARKFASKVDLLVASKQAQLNACCPTEAHRNFKEHNDVVLDPITEITIIDVKDYTDYNSKVYDLTIPSTLNFGLANGLIVVDTSSTGYIQRKLVKAMEDCKVSYDMTVRNANGNIVQFLYGEDGMDAIKIETQPMHYITKSMDELESDYLLSVKDNLSVILDKETLTAFEGDPAWEERMYEHFAQVCRDREFVIKQMFNGEQETSVMYPISFQRILTNTQALYKKYKCDGLMSDLNPLYVLDEIEKMCEELFVTQNNRGNKLLHILLRMYLSPKQMVLRYRFNKTAFQQIVQLVKARFWDSIVNPSEMVGVIAAQSIGEPCTQMTLNSVEWNTPLLLSVNNELHKVEIGRYIDGLLGKLETSDIESHPNNTTLGWIKNDDVKILSCDTKGKVSWEKVEAVTRHPPQNEDGTSTLLKVTTRSGRSVIATKAKSFLKRVDNEIVQVNGADVKVGDFLPISNVLPLEPGMLAHAPPDSENSLEGELPAWVLAAPDAYAKDLLKTHFAFDVEQQAFVARSRSASTVETLQQLLLRFGASSFATKDRDVLSLWVSWDNAGNVRDLFDFEETFWLKQDTSELDTVPDIKLSDKTLPSVHRGKVAEMLNNTNNAEDIKVLQQILDEDIHYDEVISIEEHTSEHDMVYDLTVANTRNFNIYNGLAMADTFHLSGVSSASKAVRGVPRIEELTRVTKNVKAPSMVIYIKEEYNQNKEQCMAIKNRLEITTFKDIVQHSRIYYDPDDFRTNVVADQPLVRLYQEYNIMEECDKEQSPWLLRLELDRQKMLDHGLTMLDLHHRLNEHHNSRISCMFTDDNAGDLIFRIKLEKSSDMLTDIKALESTILENLTLKGIEKVDKVELIKKDHLKYDDDAKVFQKSHEWCMDTDGTNLIEVLANSFVDATRTVSNDVNEVYAIFGIEAARQSLYNELYSVIKDAEASVNFRHLSILVDTMTNKGTLMSIDRHGINKGDIGPLAKCSFEEVNDVLVKAGVFTEIDRVNGVSANIILGQVAPCGTGDSEILIDEALLHDPVDVFDQNQNAMDRNASMDELAPEIDDLCALDNLSFDFKAPETDSFIEKKKELEVKFV
jgi:DNA-directed RNA polymerase beta' subunit